MLPALPVPPLPRPAQRSRRQSCHPPVPRTPPTSSYTLPKNEKIAKVRRPANEVSRVRDSRVLYLEHVHSQSLQMLLQLLEIGAIVQITKGLRRPMMRVCMRIDND